jgi:hypothetical protein
MSISKQASKATLSISTDVTDRPLQDAVPQSLWSHRIKFVPNQAAADYLEARGSNLEELLRAGGEALANARHLDPMYPAAPALVFRFTDPRTNEPLTYIDAQGVVRPFERIRPLSTQGAKFLQPRGSGTHVYFAPHPNVSWRDVLADPSYGLVISEGETRSLAGAVHDLPVIALTGVDCGQVGGKLHSDLDAVDWRARQVFLAFDSDVSRKPGPQRALQKLAALLRERGATVYVTSIPPLSDGTKQGLDDYLAHNSVDEFEALLKSPETVPAVGSDLDVFEVRSNDDEEITVAEILKREVAPVAELIPGWIERGIPNFLAGPGGVHKSRLALQWGLGVNAGVGVWGIPTGAATLVYVSAEDDADEIARRAQAIAAQHQLKDARLLRRKNTTAEQGIIISRKGKDSALVIMGENGHVEVRPFYHELVARLRAIPGHKFVVLDSAYDFVRFTGRAKIDEDAVNFFVKIVLQSICDKADCTVLIPWHPSQAGSERENMDGWSVAWHNAPRARLALKAVKDVSDTYELSVTKRNHGPKGRSLTLRFHEGALLPVDTVPDDGKVAAVRAACIEAAVYAAGIGAPFTQQRNIVPQIVEGISKKAGVVLTSKRIKDELEAACHRGELHYQKGYGRVKAGYFPAVPPPTATVETGAETPLRPAVETA